MRASTRWTIAVLSVVVLLIVALALELREPTRTSTNPPAARSGAPDLAALRARADLPPCQSGPGDSGPEPLRGVTVECLADGSAVDAGRSVGGRTVLLNLWAYWCAPCAEELPAMAEYQRRVGTDLTVVTVHQDANQAAALTRLAEYGVHLPAWQDADRRVAAALRVPNVMPATVVLRADGSVAGILPRAFVSADEISAAVEQTMGERR